MILSQVANQTINGIHHFDTGPFNWYLIEEDSRLTLVDAGFPGHYKIFKAGIEVMGYRIKDVDAIVLTHAHADHIGFAKKVRKEANCPLLMPDSRINFCSLHQKKTSVKS